MAQNRETLEKIVLTRVMRLNATIHGVVFGLVAGLALFIATNWLIIKGGPIGPEGEPIIGPNLWLLSNFFYGYSVTFAYAFVAGFIAGFLIAQIYNWIVDFREYRARRSA